MQLKLKFFNYKMNNLSCGLKHMPVFNNSQLIRKYLIMF